MPTLSKGVSFSSGDTVSSTTLNNLVDDATIVPAAITAAHLGSGIVVNAAVSATAAIDYSKLATLTGGSILVGNASDVATSVAMSGDGTLSSAGALTIAAGAVETAMLAANAAMPAGAIIQYGGSTVPSTGGWLLCDGTTGKDSVADTTLAALFTAIGVTYGGSGADDFDLPDLRGKVPVGLAASGTFNALNATGGAETHALIEAELAAHAHTIKTYTKDNDTVGEAGYAPSGTNQSSPTGAEYSGDSVQSTGNGTAHENMPPYIVVNFIIKT